MEEMPLVGLGEYELKRHEGKHVLEQTIRNNTVAVLKCRLCHSHRDVVAISLSANHDRKPCKYGRTDRDAV